MKKNQSGILFIELLMYILVVAIFSIVAMPRIVYTTKRLATKSEMARVVGMIQLYEVENDHLPLSLNNLRPLYFSDDKYKKDFWLNPYTYTVVTRKLCSTNIDVGCLDF